MKVRNLTLTVLLLLTLLSCNNNESRSAQSDTDLNNKLATDKSEQAESTIIVQEDSTEFIYTAEYVLFWNKFSKALVRNDSHSLSQLVDDNLYGIYYIPFELQDICTMDFAKDSIITKARFIKEFSKSLNPVFIDLLNYYEVHKDTIRVKTREDVLNRYRCSNEVNGKIFFVFSYLAREFRNEVVLFEFRSRVEEDFHSEGQIIELLFRKTNNEIKLSGIEFNNLTESATPIEVIDHSNDGDQTKWSPRVY